MGYSEWLESSELEWILKWITEELGFLKSQIEDSAKGTNNQTDEQEDTTPAENTNIMKFHSAAHNTERTNGVISKVWSKKTSWEIAIWWVVSNITWWVTRGEKMARLVEGAQISAEDYAISNNSFIWATNLLAKKSPLNENEIKEAQTYIETFKLLKLTYLYPGELDMYITSLQKLIDKENEAWAMIWRSKLEIKDSWSNENSDNEAQIGTETYSDAENYDIERIKKKTHKYIKRNCYTYILWWNHDSAEEALENRSLCYLFDKEYNMYIGSPEADILDPKYNEEFSPEKWDSIIIAKLFYEEIEKQWKHGIKEININGININNNPVTRYIRNQWLIDRIKNNNGILHLDDLDNKTKSYVLERIWLKDVDDLINILDNEVENIYVADDKEVKNKLMKIIKENPEINSILSSESFKSYIDGEEDIKVIATLLFLLWSNKIPKELVDLRILKKISKNVSKTHKDSHDSIERINQWKLERNKWIKWANTHIVVEEDPTIWYTDLQTASWADIARNAWLWEDLKKYDINKNIEVSDEHMKHIQQEAFPTAWHNFIENNDDISGYIDDLDMKLIYNFDNNSINESKRKILSERLKGDFWDGIDLDKIHSRLSWFLTEMDNVKNQLTEDHILENWIVYENTKLDAIGWVIDSIKNIFDKMWENMKFWQLCEGFKYDEREPLKIEWDKLVIKGLLNGTKTKMCYDLKNWDLYMNSFIKESVNPAMITVGDRWNEWEDYPEADVKIWSINSFEDILSDIDISEECDIENEWDIHPHDAPHLDDINRPDIPGPRITNGWWSIKNVTNRPGLKGNGNDTNNNYPKRSKNSHYTAHMAKEKPVWRQIRSPSWTPRYLPWRSQKPGWPAPFEPQASIEETIKINAKINNAIDLIWEEVRRHTEKQSQKNDIIIKFMKTFNIVSNQWTIKSMQFHEGSNIYNLLHIIENSDSNQLSKFSSFMNDISKYSGLARWNNNPPEIQNNKMLKEIKESNQNDNNSARWCLKKSLMNFKGESVNIWNQNVLNFESNYRLWIAQLIIDNIITNPKDVANSKFETIKIDSFLRSLNTGYWINEYADDNPDDILNQLDNV